MTKALTGPLLLTKLGELSGVSRSEAATACGYVRTIQKGDGAGNVVPATEQFLAAIAEANGVQFAPGRRGFQPSGSLSVYKSGQVILGPAYLGLIKAEPCAAIKVEVVEEAGEVVISVAA